MENTPLKNNDNVTVVPVLATQKFKFSNIIPFKGKKDQTIGQITIGKENIIILIPQKWQKTIKRGLAYDFICHELSSGTGYVVDRYDFHVPVTEITLSDDFMNVAVMHAQKPTAFSFDISGAMSPKEFYESKKFHFNEQIKTPSAFLKWKAALQQISQHWTKFRGEWDIHQEPEIVSIKSLWKEPTYELAWKVDPEDELDGLAEK